jgi:uncharacterized circularly permuted ATP-grasp superfamily protein
VSLWKGYGPLPATFDEYFEAEDRTRPAMERVTGLLAGLGRDGFKQRQALADQLFLRGGVTFSVYADRRGTDKIFPFDVVPRVVPAEDWAHIERGLLQRVRALDAFIADSYGDQRIVAAGKLPASLVSGAQGFRPEVIGVRPPGGRYVHIAGIDLVRGSDGRWMVLEDNLRVPSGVSYVLENRAVLKRVLPLVFKGAQVRAVDDYPLELRRALLSIAPAGVRDPQAVLLTPGPFNSAYFEHSYLARRMGVPLVEGSDLRVRDGRVWLRTTGGPRPVDVIYRRVDDEFLDPRVFRKDSLLGVPGLMEAYKTGRVALANAVGNGVADSKALYAFVPDLIRFYLGEEPVLDQVETWRCEVPSHLDHVLANLAKLVVKEVEGSGGYGMLVGPTASKPEREAFATKLRARPGGFVAQPLVELSTCPTWIGGRLEPRRVDLRPYVVSGADRIWVLPGGLTRVALPQGSYVVNSSQGGGSKDTWVLE